ncbi:murein tripeptide amidase MpaA [Klebsiella variicola subsp. variicola]|nr:murein tripeptide amidase MpaA [Klebsiella variicola subsp. variicola]
MSISRPRPQRGDFPPGTRQYGSSELGAPLLWFPAPQADSRSGLIIAGTHGDENSSIVTLSCALRTPKPELRRHHVVLTVNPDGCQLGLRANARGVDLNRNFPAANWKQGGNGLSLEQRGRGTRRGAVDRRAAGFGAETQALCQLIHQIHPAWVVSLSRSAGLYRRPGPQPAGALAGRRLLPAAGGQRGLRHAGLLWQLVRGYRAPCITAEFPPVSADEATERYLPAMTDLLRWQA